MSELMTVGQALTMSSIDLLDLVNLTPKGVHWVAGQWSKHQEAAHDVR